MHGVRKQPTTAEQRAERAVKLDKKKVIYQTAMDRLHAKRQNDEYDSEMLSISGQVLERNADIYTLWNMRKLCVLRVEKVAHDTKGAGDVEKSLEKEEESPEEKLASAFKAELQLTQNCLQSHPKSYGSWHHRAWCVQRMPKPDYEKEIKLCNEVRIYANLLNLIQALKYDERNFHCWDYRRTICKLAGTSAADELKFSDDKVADNFSNYSAWHYRSTLMPSLYPDAKGDLVIEESKIRSELSKARQAYFTDPEDSAAWIYSQWLLSGGKNCQTTSILLASIDSHGNTLHISTDRGVHVPGECTVTMNDDFNATVVKATSVTGAHTDFVWKIELAGGVPKEMRVLLFQNVQFSPRTSISLHLSADLTLTSTLTSFSPTIFINHTAVRQHLQQPTFVSKKDIEQQITDVDELIEAEAELTWPLQANTDCMIQLDRKTYSEKIVENYNKLMKLDPHRRNFYSDQLSIHTATLKLMDFFDTASSPSPSTSPTTLNLRDCHLTTIPVCIAPLLLCVTDLTLDSNNLTDTRGLRYAARLERVSLAENSNLGDLAHLGVLKELDFIGIPSCSIKTADQLTELAKLPKLTKLLMAENAICDDEEKLEKVMKMFDKCRVMPFWL